MEHVTAEANTSARWDKGNAERQCEGCAASLLSAPLWQRVLNLYGFCGCTKRRRIGWLGCNRNSRRGRGGRQFVVQRAAVRGCGRSGSSTGPRGVHSVDRTPTAWCGRCGPRDSHWFVARGYHLGLASFAIVHPRKDKYFEGWPEGPRQVGNIQPAP